VPTFVAAKWGAKALLEKLPACLLGGVRVSGSCVCASVNRRRAAVVTQNLVPRRDARGLRGEWHSANLYDIQGTSSTRLMCAAGGYFLLRDCVEHRTRSRECVEDHEDSGLSRLGGAGFPTAASGASCEPSGAAIDGREYRRRRTGTFKDGCTWSAIRTASRGHADRLVGSRHLGHYIYLRDDIRLRALLEAELPGVQDNPGAVDRVFELRGCGRLHCGEAIGLIECDRGKRGMPRLRSALCRPQSACRPATLEH